MSEAQALIAVPLPIATEAFSYLVPEEFTTTAAPGVRVRVPFRNRELTGYLVSTAPVSDPGPRPQIKPILAVLDEAPVLSVKMLALTKWVADYYGSSWGEAIENALPRWVKYGKKTEKYIAKAQEKGAPPSEKPVDYELTPEQKKAFEIILGKLEQIKSTAWGHGPRAMGHETSARLDVDRGSCPVLLFGVTGSGKSELYIRTIKETLKQGRSAIVLVPEIALTEQLKRFFAGHFGGELEILHSKMTDGERFLAWKRIEFGTCRVVLGPRSAVFAPVPDLGLIIMDEEHEGSYKQETTPRYHAREVALWRSRHENALFIMGTATPSLESMRAAERGDFIRLDLTRRIDEKAMPKVEVIDLKRYEGEKKPSAIFSPPLLKEIEKNLAANEGTMLLLNRRGFSTSIRCRECGETEKCKACQVSLTYHQETGRLLCHYCNYQRKVPETCSSCKAPILKFMGFGTEKVESEVAKFFPKARIARLDADTTKKKDAHEKILEAFREKKIDVLIGTQMIAKGFDFPHVTLVGVVLADVGLKLPDFRSGERTFQLMTQFAGRAGRGSKPGRVYIQTYLPDHPSLAFAKNHDFLSYYTHETRFRDEFHYPPFRSLVNIIIRSRDEKKAYLFAREMRDELNRILGNSGLGTRDLKRQGSQTHPEERGTSPRSQRTSVEIIGPAPLPFYKLRGHFRWHVMLKLPTLNTSHDMTQKIYRTLMKLKKPSSVAFAIDVDPLNIL